MKSTFTRVMVSSLLIAFAVGCGKKDSGSSAPAPVKKTASTIKTGVVTEGSKALTALKGWYAKADTINIGSFGYFERSSTSSNPQFEFDFNFCFFGSGDGCDQMDGIMNTCYVKGPNGKYGVTATSSNGWCEVLPTQFTYSKSTNALLGKAVKGESGLVLKSINQNGTKFTVKYGPSQSPYATKLYVIDTAYHSILNPVVVQDESEITQVTGFRILN